MKVIDANVLLYAVNASDPKHEAARRWLDVGLNGADTIALPWSVLLAFIRLSTKVGLFPKPLTAEQAVDRIAAWLNEGGAVVIGPTQRHLHILSSLLAEVGTGGNLVSDAHLAALAVEHDAIVVSYDSDFARFAGVRHEQPPR